MKFDASGWLDVAIEINCMQKSMSRSGLRPTHLVLHATAGGSSAENIGNYFKDSNVEASTHFVIGQDGHIVQCVSCDVASWGNGIVDNPRMSLPPAINPNLYTISIEHVKPSTDNSDQITTAQKAASFQLVQAICDHYNVPKRPGDIFGGIISHADIDSVSRARCPGHYPWGELWTFLKGGQPPVVTPPSKYQIADAAAEWNSTAALFPGSAAPNYTSGISQAWRQRLYAGQRMGPPLTNEYDSTDWGGNAIKVQQFTNARCEWRVDGSSCRFFDARGEL